MLKRTKTEVADSLQSPMKAGFPNPAEEANLAGLSLHDLVVKHPASTFFMRFGGHITDYGLFKGDLLVIDKSLDPQVGDLVIAVASGEFKVAKVAPSHQGAVLQMSNGEKLSSEEDTEVWGVIISTVHQFKRSNR